MLARKAQEARQRCPNCSAPHATGIYVSGQRATCARCGIKFEVVRGDSEPGRAVATPVATVEVNKSAVRGDFHDTVVRRPTVPGYRLENLLGRGGMGEVWRGTQISLDRPVAVKILATELAKEADLVARFEKEARALAAVDHPGIVSVIDRGQTGETHFFTMELVEGKSLRERIDAGRVSQEEAIALTLSICDALAAAHVKGVTHRDLKPENILITPRGDVKVIDFGLASLTRASGRWQMTGDAMTMGTVQYMAPEQQRDAKLVDGRADVFSMGVMLYEMLTGDLPAGRFELPSVRFAGLSPLIDGVIERALEPEPGMRYHSIAEMAAALRAVERDLLRSSGDELKDWIEQVRRVPKWAIAITLVVVAVLAARAC